MRPVAQRPNADLLHVRGSAIGSGAIEARTFSEQNSPLDSRCAVMTASHYDRQREHASHALAALERLRRANREHVYPSTSELQQEGLYGLRPPNRFNDLARGKYNGVRYDIEKINCGHGIYRWKLHEPARPGYPKNPRQEVLSLDGERAYRSMTKARRSRGSWKSQSIFTTKSWQQISAERERKLSAPEPDFVLTP